MEKKEKKLWNRLKGPLKILVTLVLIYFVFQKIDIRDVKGLFLNSDPVFIGLAFLCFFISQLVASWRLLGFLRAINIDISFGQNFRLYLVGLFYNVYSAIGGDGYKVYMIRRRFKHPTKKIILALLLDRVSGVWAIGLIAVILIILIPRIGVPPAAPALALLAGTVLYYVILQVFFREYNRHFFKAHIKAVSVQSLQLLCVIFILLSQDFNGKFSPYLFSFLLSSIAAVIPISAFGFGTREYVMTHTSGIFDMNQALAVFVTLAFSILSTLVAMTGIWYIYRSREFEPAPTQEEAEAFEKKADSIKEETTEERPL